MPTVDQQRVRRTRTRLIAHDPVRALQGYTLFTPMFGDGTVYLVDMRGEVVHTWRLPHRPGLYGYLLDNGHLFNPHFFMETGRPGLNNWVFRAFRYTAEEIDRARGASS